MLSLVFWALIIIISIKYLVFILRADNRGEGGILALTSLVTPVGTSRRGGRRALILLGLFGTALLYGDGMITPAISVLSAVEGLKVATPLFEPYIIPITIIILVALFSVQRRGTASLGKLFGPVTLLWFAMLAVLGVSWVVRAPAVLWAINPMHGARFFMENGGNAFLVLGSVFLVVTGGEALYADMGHFGKSPIRYTWFTIVLPALLLNYFGQGALLILEPDSVENPFYSLAPEWALYPVVLIATAATVIASQALISGVFSLTRQAVQLGYCPRMHIEHTSTHKIGQIYIPAVNWALMGACIALVLGFRTSSNLAAAYGVAVTTTMVVTTLLFYVVARERWRWSLRVVILVAGCYLVIDLAFWTANLIKIPHGGWFPLVVGAAVFTMLSTWKAGRQILAERLQARTLSLEMFLNEIAQNPPTRVQGTAVFMSSNPYGTPPAILHNLKHNQVLHQRVIFLSVVTEEVPYVNEKDMFEIRPLGEGIFQIVLRVGFMENLNIPETLARIRHEEIEFKPMTTSYFLGSETLIITKQSGMASWRQRLFTVMARNARPASTFFGLPANRVVELGAHIQL